MAVTLPARSRAVPGIAAVLTIGLLSVAGRYGPHRDELYFVVAGHHRQWGYPDQPPLTPLVAGVADRLAPGSLFALRLVPALLIGAVVLLTADLARELGGERRAQVLAAITVATGAAPLIAPSWSRTISTVPGSGSAFNVTSTCCRLITPTWAVLPSGGAFPPTSSSEAVPSSHATVCGCSRNESTVVAPATYM